jgi:iron complex outermembrane receptor protein
MSIFPLTVQARLLCLIVGTLPLTGISDASESPVVIDDVTVTGQRLRELAEFHTDLSQSPITVPDSAELLRKAPGGGVNRNGPLSGIAQYRGMYGDRVNVAIDGMHVCTGGPNGMDPPLSYIPRSQLQTLTVSRGIAPVSAGMETLGGAVIAQGKSSDFSDNDTWVPSLELDAGGSSADGAMNLGASASLASRSQRIHGSWSREQGDDMEFPGGTILPTRFERDNYTAGYGFRAGIHELSLDVRHGKTGPTGAPALPMDIAYIDTDVIKLEYQGQGSSAQVHAMLSWNQVDHGMNNFQLRSPPMPTMTRLNTTWSEGLGYRADVALGMGSGQLVLGLDGQFNAHDATITDPLNNPAFRVDGFNDIQRDLQGLFAEWKGPVGAGLDAELGLRVNRVQSDSGQVSHFMAGMNPAIGALQDRFNNADRSQSDTNYDLVARLNRPLSSELSLTLEGARKSRSPSYQERYLWIPLQATNGLADGHNYMGGIELDPEVAMELGLGLAWRHRDAYLEPQLFYRQVNDYIQGIPSTDPLVIAVSTAGGDPNPLQFANVDAVLYGADATWGISLDEGFALDGVLSYVRGERDDVSDNLYRIAPLNGRATLSYRRDDWWAAAEGVAYARQDKVSATNDELATSGYGLLNLRAGLSLGQSLSLSAGVENLLDREYADHLAGINRVAGSDVPPGVRLPGIGRSFFLALNWRYL